MSIFFKYRDLHFEVDNTEVWNFEFETTKVEFKFLTPSKRSIWQLRAYLFESSKKI